MPDKGWGKKVVSVTLVKTNLGSMNCVKLNKVYKLINKAGFHIQTVYCELAQGNIV